MEEIGKRSSTFVDFSRTASNWRLHCADVRESSNRTHGGGMTKSEFLNEIDAIVQADPGSTTMDDQIASLRGWDSMAIIMFIAMTDEKLNVTLDIKMLASCETVGDLARLCDAKVV
jgi:acyl carrier protein